MKKITIKKIKRKIKYHWLVQRLFFQSCQRFKKKVRRKSKGFCGLCGDILQTGSYQIHHIYPKRWYPKLKCEPKNGVCLCSSCHKFTDHLTGMQGQGSPYFGGVPWRYWKYKLSCVLF